MLRKNAKVELIRNVPLFAECTKAELEDVASLADEISFPAGKSLIREGERGREFVVIVDGTVEVTRKGKEVPARGGSSFFGEIALISEAPRNATVTTTSPVRALVITDRAFHALLERSPTIQLKILKTLAERLAPEAV
jgi:CRP-like cAMP-binding protein